MTSARRAVYGLACLLVLTGVPVGAQQPPDPGPEVEMTRVGGGLYRVDENGQSAMVLVGTEGIVVVDPLNLAFARRLHKTLTARFPGQAVKYVVYTGVDQRRSGGAAVFAKSADLVAHDGFDALLLSARGRGPASEPWTDVMSSESAYVNRRTLNVGGERAELVYPGPALGLDQTVVFFPERKIVFVSRHPSLTEPFADRRVRATLVAQWLDTVTRLDFYTMLVGDGGSIARGEVDAAHEYVRSMVDGLVREANRGRSVAQIQGGSTIGRFEGTPFARVRDGDIAALHRRTVLTVVEGFASAMVDDRTARPGECAALNCHADSTTGPAFAGGASWWLSRYRASVEFGTGARMTQTMSTTFAGLGESRRDTYFSMLGGVRIKPAGTFNVSLLGGVSHVATRIAGNVSSGFRTEAYAVDRSQFAFTVGADLAAPVGRRLHLVIPIRVTPGLDTAGDGLNGLDLRAGVGLTLTVVRQPL